MKILKIDKNSVQMELTKKDVIDFIENLTDNKKIIQFFIDMNVWMDEYPEKRGSLYGNKYE